MRRPRGGKEHSVWEELKRGHCGWIIKWEKVVGDEVREMGRDSVMQAMERNLDVRVHWAAIK